MDGVDASIEILPALGAGITLVLGLLGLLRPASAAAFANVSPVGEIGVSEIRATYGGLFAAMGAYVLLSGSTAAATVLGSGWIGAAAGRLLSVVVDRSRSAKNLGGVVFEAAIGFLLLWR